MIIHSQDNYYKLLGSGVKVIGIDWDNTVVVDEWPYCGKEIEGAADVLHKIVDAGHKIILFTQRSYEYPVCCKELVDFAAKNGYTDNGNVDLLSEPVAWFRKNRIPLFGVNGNTVWEEMTDDNGRKVYMDILIDDHNLGLKFNIVKNRFGKDCKTVDWNFVEKSLKSLDVI